METNNRCPGCGAQLEDGETLCKYCGEKVSFQNENIETVSDATDTETVSNKPTNKGRSFLATLLVIFVSAFVRVGVRTGLENRSERKDMREMNAYIEQTQKYSPGYIKDNKYVSSHLGFEFAATDPWTMFEADEIKSTSDTVRTSVKSALIEFQQTEMTDFSLEIRNKFVDTFFANLEMGASYSADDGIVGVVQVFTMGYYGIDSTSPKDLLESFGTSLSFDKQEKKTIAGNEYLTSSGVLETEGIKLNNEAMLLIKDGVASIILLQTVEGYEDFVTDSFLNRITPLN